MRSVSATILPWFLAVTLVPPVSGQSGNSIPSGAPNTVLGTSLEMADGFLGADISIEHYWIGFLGTHVTGGLDFGGGYDNLSAGLSVLPLPFLLGQADIGVAGSNEHIVDAPTFSPHYLTHIRGGILIPVGQPAWRFPLSMMAALTTVVGESEGGFPPPGLPSEALGPHRVVERFGSFLLGVRMNI